MTTTTYKTHVTTVHSEARNAAYAEGKSDALAGKAPLFTYLADLDLYARYDSVSGYVDGYESVANPAGHERTE